MFKNITMGGIAAKLIVSEFLESVTVVAGRQDVSNSGLYLALTGELERELKQKGIGMFLSIVDNDDEDFVPLSIKQSKTSGVLLMGNIASRILAQVAVTGIPVVLIDSPGVDLKLDHVIPDNYLGAYEITGLIMESGHTGIGFVGDIDCYHSFGERFRGFTDCIRKQHKHKINQFNITGSSSNSEIPFSVGQFKNVMISGKRPTALVCANDHTASIVNEILKEIDLRIPEDVSVVGFDNVQKSELLVKKLTTVNIPVAMLAQRAVDLLLKRIEDPGRNVEKILVSTNIVMRDSVGMG